MKVPISIQTNKKKYTSELPTSWDDITLKEFFTGIAPAQLLAFSTSSSAATLPVTMECVEDNLGVKNEVVPNDTN